MKKLRNWICLQIGILLCVISYAQVKTNIYYELKQDSTPIVNPTALNTFFQQLTSRNEELVRIVHWGDSHIQMGYLSEEIRTGIDSLYGLNGFGSVFPYRAAGYNPNHSMTRIKKGKWTGGNIMKDTLSTSSGFMGFWATTFDSSAIIQFGISSTAKFKEGHTHISIFLTADTNTQIKFYGLNFKKDSSNLIEPVYVKSEKLVGQLWSVTELIFPEYIDIIEVDITNNTGKEGVNIHGGIFEFSWKKGVTYNSCGVGGAQFKHLQQNTPTPISELKYLKPDLIIISFGSNESYSTQFDKAIYTNAVIKLVDEIKIALPQTSILFTGPPDTKSKNRYPRNTNTICTVLNELSFQKGYAYWDLRSAMGGEGSIIKWLAQGLAATDKLHFTRKGYTLQGKWMLNAINKSFDKYLQTGRNEK